MVVDMPITQEKMQEINERVIQRAKTDEIFARMLHKDPWQAVKLCCEEHDDEYLSKEDLSKVTAGMLQMALCDDELNFVVDEIRALIKQDQALNAVFKHI